MSRDLDEALIGQWTRRPVNWSSRWHKVETTIRNRAVTYCGRQMDEETPEGFLEFLAEKPNPHLQCIACGRAVKRKLSA